MAIAQLKTRTLADKFANDVRASRRKYGRYVYVALVFVALGYLADLFAGPYLWLDAGGMVSADRMVVSVPNESMVLRVDVTPGQRVRRGQLLGVVQSPEVSRFVAELKTRYVDTASKAADLNIQLYVAKALETITADRLRIAQANFDKVGAFHDFSAYAAARAPGAYGTGRIPTTAGLATDVLYGNEARELFDARLQYATYKAKREVAAEQSASLNGALTEAKESIAEIERRYNKGRVVASEDGVIGAQTAQKGDVLKPGDILVELNSGTPHVLAYLETGTLYKVNAGDRVQVASGFRKSAGTVEEVLPLAVQLPPEFQKTFRPRGRGQVARIRMDDPDFPLNTKVEVTSESYLPASWTGALERARHGVLGAVRVGLADAGHALGLRGAAAAPKPSDAS